MCCWFFVFKRKTAFELRISDWSSDVCSSDLEVRIAAGEVIVGERKQLLADEAAVLQSKGAHAADLVGRRAGLDAALHDQRVPAGQAVKVADALPHPPGGRGHDGRGVDFRHASVVLDRKSTRLNSSH